MSPVRQIHLKASLLETVFNHYLSGQMSGALIAGIVIAAVAVPVAVVLLVVFYRYRQRTKCQESANGNTAKTVLDTMEPLCGPR